MAAGSVLIVEDDPRMRRLIKRVLDGAGYETDEADTLESARGALQRATPDLVLLDLGLPDGDGLTLCRELHEGGADAPATVVLTAHGDQESRALAAGARDFLTKPVRVRPLIAHLAAALRDRRLLELEREKAEISRALALAHERERIAMDMHDGTVQSLVGVSLALAAAARRLPPPDGALRTELERASRLIAQSIGDLRSYIEGLRTGRQQTFDLRAELTRLAGPPLQLSVGVDLVEMAERLGAEATAHLLQVAREAVANARRHAAASAIELHLGIAPDGLALTIRDDGCGFDPSTVAHDGGQGLGNLVRRASALGGRLEIASAPGTGTLVSLRLPLPG